MIKPHFEPCGMLTGFQSMANQKISDTTLGPRIAEWRLWILSGTVLAVTFGTKAHGQTVDAYFPTNIPVYEDPSSAASLGQRESDYAPQAQRVGDFMIRLPVSLGIGYETNPFGTRPSVGSRTIDTNATLTIDSDWARDSLDAAFLVDNTRYSGVHGASLTSWSAALGGVLDYGDDKISVGYSHVNAVALPTTAGLFGLRQAINDQADDFRISDTIGPGPLTLVPAVVGQVYSFGTASGDQLSATEGLYDRDALTESLTTKYAFAGGHTLVFVLKDSQVTYNNGSSATRPVNYNDTAQLVGIEYTVSALLSYHAFIGYEERFATSRGPGKRALSAPAAGLALIYRPSVLTTLTGTVRQSLQDQPTQGGQGATETDAMLVLNYDYRANIKLVASGGFARVAFPAGQPEETTVSASAAATWTVSRHIALSLRYDFTMGEPTSQSAPGFSNHQIMLQAKFQL